MSDLKWHVVYVKWLGKVMCIAKELAFGNFVLHGSWNKTLRKMYSELLDCKHFAYAIVLLHKILQYDYMC